MRKLSVALNILAVLSLWILASQIWASATISQTQNEISISGIDAYPQIVLILLIGLLVLWLAKYLNSLFAKFLTSTVVVLLFATAAPIWFESASGSLAVLRPQLTATTGISDLQGQMELVSTNSYNHLAADGFVVALFIWCASLLLLIWSRNSGISGKQFGTRIDKLPSW